MKSINRWRLIRARTAVYAAAVALAGSAFAAGPAQAAQPTADEETCVVILPAEFMKCFATPEAADEFVGDVQVGPTRGQGPGLVAGPDAQSTGRSTAQILTLITIAYDAPVPVGPSVRVYGTAGPCSLTFNDVDYEWPNMGAWNNRISLFFTYSICWLGGYDLPNFGGAFRGYTPSANLFAGPWDNDISSIRWT